MPQCAASQLPNLAVVGGTVAVGILLDVEPCRWATHCVVVGDQRASQPFAAAH